MAKRWLSLGFSHFNFEQIFRTMSTHDKTVAVKRLQQMLEKCNEERLSLKKQVAEFESKIGDR